MQRPGTLMTATAVPGSASRSAQLSTSVPGEAQRSDGVRVMAGGIAPKPKLLDQVRQAIRARHYSKRTEKSYVDWIKRFIFFHPALRDHPLEMAETEINQFLADLAVSKKVSASTQNQALSAILFLYQYVLKKPLEWIDPAVRAKRPKRLPVVLTREEVINRRPDGGRAEAGGNTAVWCGPAPD